MSLMDAIIAANMVGDNSDNGNKYDKRFGLKMAELTTPLVISETVILSQRDATAISEAVNSGLPAIIIFEIEGLGRFHAIFDVIPFDDGYAYQHSLVMITGECIVVTIIGSRVLVEYSAFQLAEME